MGLSRDNAGPRYLPVKRDEASRTFKTAWYWERVPASFPRKGCDAAWPSSRKVFLIHAGQYPQCCAASQKINGAGELGMSARDISTCGGRWGLISAVKESAMIESIEGKRGPAASSSALSVAQSGPFSYAPTLVAAVETPHWVHVICREGP